MIVDDKLILKFENESQHLDEHADMSKTFVS